jgi:uncharacterized protein
VAHNPDRESYFPKIEKRYGQPMKYWFQIMKDLDDLKYPEQVAFLKEEHGFSQAHANALVMYSRGSKSSKRFETLNDYLNEHDAVKKKTIKAIFKAIQSKYPKTELVIAWNQPMLKYNGNYIFGASILKNHILITLENKLKDYKVLKKTVQVPVDWKVDEKLLQSMAAEVIKQLK